MRTYLPKDYRQETVSITQATGVRGNFWHSLRTDPDFYLQGTYTNLDQGAKRSGFFYAFTTPSPPPTHSRMLSLRIRSPLGSAWFSMDSPKAPLQSHFPFCLVTDRASPVVNSSASVHPQTQLLRGFWGPRICPSNTSLRLYSQVCEQLAPPLHHTLHWLAVLMSGQGLQALGLRFFLNMISAWCWKVEPGVSPLIAGIWNSWSCQRKLDSHPIGLGSHHIWHIACWLCFLEKLSGVVSSRLRMGGFSRHPWGEVSWCILFCV